MTVSFLFFLATLIIYFNLILPANDEEQAVKAQAMVLKDFVDSQKAAISQVQKLINSYKGEVGLQEVVSSILPFSPDLAGAFSQISGLTEVNKLSMQGTTVSIPVNQAAPVGGSAAVFSSLIKPFGSVDIEFKVSGTYGDFKAFMKNLETNIRIFDVKRMSIQPAGKPNQDNYIYDITVAAYYQNS